MEERPKILHCRELAKVYHRGDYSVHALDSFDLALPKGEFLAVSGPSGSGKTTLLNILGLLDSPDSGTLNLNGEVVDFSNRRRLASLRRRYYGFVFQSFNLVPVLTAYENVELALMTKEKNRDRVRERTNRALELVGLSDRTSHRPKELSGGQQQRVAIARAIADSPAVLFADEPTANLDSTTAVSILELLASINESLETTIVLATHDPQAFEYTSRRLSLKDGKILQETER